MPELLQPTGAALFPGSFTKRFQYANDLERQLVVKFAGFARKDRTRIHLLTDSESTGTSYGFVALSFSSFDRDNANRSSIVIDYIFTSHQFRGQHFPALDGLKVFEYLLGFTFNAAMAIQKTVPVKFVALQPASDRLSDYYKRMDFKQLDNTDWMFLRI